MNFEIYCDESGLEALKDKQAHKFMAIGGIWMPAEYRTTFKQNIHDIKKRHAVKGELKWNKVSPKFHDLYKEIIDYFFSTEELRCRIITIDTKQVDHIKFNNDDVELGFYKFYYQLLHHWIFDFNQYHIFLDHKVNRSKDRLHELKDILNNSNLTSQISIVQGLPSEQSLGIQLADVFTGLVNAKFNGQITSPAKLSLVKHVESHLKYAISPTPKWEEKLNVFKINLQGGW